MSETAYTNPSLPNPNATAMRNISPNTKASKKFASTPADATASVPHRRLVRLRLLYDGLCPTEWKRRTGKDEDARNENRTDKINVAQRIERQPSRDFCGVIAKRDAM